MTSWTRGQVAAVGAALAMAAPLCAQPAQASRYGGWQGSYAAQAIYAGAARYRSYGGALQCVPFARENTGIELAGNAVNWWENAAGVYERGARPEVGSILNFRATGRMHMGHVAVVSNVVNARNVQIDHANWSGRGVVTRNVTVVDVSPANDWTAVRVALGNGDFGSVYPTFGFIYDRPDKGMMVANAGVRAGTPAAAAAPAPIVIAMPRASMAPLDLRPAAMPAASVLAPAEMDVAEADSFARPRRFAAAAMPVIHYGPIVRYGREYFQTARFNRTEGAAPRRGEMLAAHFSRGAERMTTGRLVGSQVLFIGRAPAGAAGRGYSGMVQTASTQGSRGGALRPIKAESGARHHGRRA